MSGNHIDGGRLFQSLGPATWKALSPSLVWVRGTWQVMTSAERSSRRPPTVASWHSAERYRGVSPRNDSYTKGVSLYWTRCLTRSKWSCLRTGVMWSDLRAPEMKRAAAFCTDCNRRNKLSVMPYSSELQ